MNSFIGNLTGLWSALEPRRKAALVISVGVAILFLSLMIRIIATPTLALLYSGLDSSAASGVIEALDRQGVAYKVQGDAIYVPADQRDRVRISLAGEGLPTAGAAGYELLDGLSGFGTTSEMFDAAYWRAKEGELARTILAFNSVVRARVHIANVNRRPFERETKPTASVTVSTSSGALSRQQAEAIRFLVASAVGGLALTNVAVIDQEHGVILRSGESDAEGGASDDAIAKATELRRNVTRLLEARVGPGAAIVEVTVETVRESETVRERKVDPSTRVVIHKDTEESTDAAEGEAGAVSVASNLAEGDVEGGGDQSSRQASRTRERLNYEVSEVLRESVRPPGDVKRVSVAVLVDGLRQVDEAGAVSWTPRPEEELAALRKLVESAVGFDEARGDVVTLETLEFSFAGEAGVEAASGIGRVLAANVMSLIQIGVLALVAVMLGMFVIKPILGANALPPPPGAPALAGPGEVEGELVDGEGQTIVARTQDSGGGATEAGGAVALTDGDVIDGAAGRPDRKTQLEALVAENRERAIDIVEGWLDKPDAEEAKS